VLKKKFIPLLEATLKVLSQFGASKALQEGIVAREDGELDTWKFYDDRKVSVCFMKQH
jgi:hypothetical protein